MIERVVLVVLFALFVFALGRMIIEPQNGYTVNSYSVHNYLTSHNSSSVVEVVGAVASSGVTVVIDDNMRVADAIQAAGGLTNIADVSQLDLAMVITKQTLPAGTVYIPFKNDIPNSAIPFYHPPNEFLATTGKELVNLNIATVDELIVTTGIPTKVAQNIIKYREAQGRIKSVNELRKIDGMTPEIMYRLKTKTTIQ